MLVDEIPKKEVIGDVYMAQEPGDNEIEAAIRTAGLRGG